MKKSVLVFTLATMFTGFVSASQYTSFSFENLLDSLDASLLILGCLFLIFFAILTFALGRVFKDNAGYPNKPVVTTIAFAVSAMAVYGIHKMGWNYEDFLYEIGLTTDLLNIILPILILFGLIYLSRTKNKYNGKKEFKFYRALLILGIIFSVLAFTDFIYEKGLMLAIGILLFLVGLWLWKRNKKKSSYGGYWPTTPNYGKSKSSWFKKPQRMQEWQDHNKALRNQKRQQELTEKQRAYDERVRAQQQQTQNQAQEQQQQTQQQQEKAVKKQQQELTERQQQRDKDRKRYMRQINEQMKTLQKTRNNRSGPKNPKQPVSLEEILMRELVRSQKK